MSRHSFLLQQSKLCRDIKNYVVHKLKPMSQQKELCCDKKNVGKKKRPKMDILACFQAHFIVGL